MSEEITLRPYQADAVERLRVGIRNGLKTQCLVAPTGAGKTVIAASLINECYKKSNRAIFVVDRVNLIDQTSEVFDKYGIPHGVVQANHWRRKPWERVQICSSQTLARREWPDADLIVVDECHTISQTVKKRLAKKDVIAVGLTATPFTKGLGKIYEGIVNVTSTKKLINRGYLSGFRIFVCEEPDMKGVKTNSFGEWVDSEASKRALTVVGDCVQEYLKYANGKKFICSACDTAHVEALHEQFMKAGVICEQYTYRVSDEDRAEIIREFRKPDSYIRGIITVTAATKGFDVPDIGCVIMARPLRNSLAEHIQFLGRGLRKSEGKDKCIVLDHSGNCLRFMGKMLAFFNDGATRFEEGKKKEQQKKILDDEEKYRTCPNCKCLHIVRPSCPNCGYIYPKRQSIMHENGVMREIDVYGTIKMPKADLVREIKTYAIKYKPEERRERFFHAMCKKITGHFSRTKYEAIVPSETISASVFNKIRSLNIAYAKRRRRAA